MKKVHLLALMAIIVIAACNSKPEPSHTSNTIDLTKTTTSPFTDTLKVDTFKVSLQGRKSVSSNLVFKIISSEGKEVYSTHIPAANLIKDNVKLKTEEDKINFLKNEVNYFFDEEHFLWPAVMPDEQPDKNVPDKIFYQELKQTKLNGFSYRLGTESKIYIAWSDQEKKVKVYYKL